MNIKLTVLSTILGAVLGYLGYRRISNNDIKESASKETLLETKLDYISKGVDDIRLDIKSQDKRITDIAERLIKVEESSKSAHHRIDNLEN